MLEPGFPVQEPPLHDPPSGIQLTFLKGLIEPGLISMVIVLQPFAHGEELADRAVH